MDVLKPCPFCGGEAKVIPEKYDDYKYRFYVSCKKCGVRTVTYYDDILRDIEIPEEKPDYIDDAFVATNLWNTRVKE